MCLCLWACALCQIWNSKFRCVSLQRSYPTSQSHIVTRIRRWHIHYIIYSVYCIYRYIFMVLHQSIALTGRQLCDKYVRLWRMLPFILCIWQNSKSSDYLRLQVCAWSTSWSLFRWSSASPPGRSWTPWNGRLKFCNRNGCNSLLHILTITSIKSIALRCCISSFLSQRLS